MAVKKPPSSDEKVFEHLKKLDDAQEKKKTSKADEELFELLSPKRNIDLRIEKMFQDLPEKFVVLLLEKVQEYAMISLRLMHFFSENEIPGIYISTNKPLSALMESLNAQKINYKNVFFVDAVTKTINAEIIEGTNFVYIDSPKNLTDLSVAIEAGAQKIKGEKKFIIFDSLSTLLVYNKAGVVEKFTHSVAGKMRTWNAKGFFLMVENRQDETTKTIAQFCDETVEI